MFRQWEPTTCWEAWSATLIWSAALCSSVSYLKKKKRTALPARHNPNTVRSPFSRGSRGADAVIWSTTPSDLTAPPPHPPIPLAVKTQHPQMFTQPQRSELIRVKTHDTSVSRFLISWKARAPPPAPPLLPSVCMRVHALVCDETLLK